MALKKIAIAEISREEAMSVFMSYEYLRDTRSRKDGPLQKVVAWFKEEDAMNFDTRHMRIGRESDDYAILYYFESKRWKIGKDGRAFVSSADADNMMEREEKDLQLLIDTILNAELTRALARALKNEGQIKIGRVKHPDAEEGYYTKTLLGIQG